MVAADGVLRLTLNRPEVFNALTGEMADEVAALIEGATARDDVRVIVLSGTGAAFSTGADISGADAHEGFDVTALDAVAGGFSVRVLQDLCAGVAEDTSRRALEEMRRAGATLV